MGKMDYLITGGSGFIGKNLRLRLASQCSVVNVDINPQGDPGAHILDVAQRLPNFYGNTLVHLAAYTNIRQSLAHPRTTITSNINSLLNCIDLVRTEKFNTLVFTSSASSALSASPYLASKAAGEAICNAYYKSYNLDIRVLKLSSVYGPHSIHKNSVIAAFIKRCLNKCSLLIYGDGSQSRDFIHVDDVVNAIISGKSGYICSGKLVTIKYLAETIREISKSLIGFTPIIHYENFIPGEVLCPEIHCDIDPTISLEDGLYNTFKWFIENYEH
jgi:UDP-glucose 4-epimerase